MITRITGVLIAVSDVAATIRIGGFEYEVLIPDLVRRQLSPRINDEISLRTIEYLDGNPQQGRLIPRIVGFTCDAEKEFFELFCSVDGVGVKKALRAMVRPVREVAEAIEEQDVKTLSTLPGVGPAVAERIIAKLRRKMTKFALMIAASVPEGEEWFFYFFFFNDAINNIVVRRIFIYFYYRNFLSHIISNTIIELLYVRF